MQRIKELHWTMCPRCKKNKREVEPVHGTMFMYCYDCNEEDSKAMAQREKDLGLS